ncbi:MAG: GNAT family N-acetyltransferase [Renibacterium sp.]|nr:GNAT family N-acetyltransferase [Renibacterium sp.]
MQIRFNPIDPAAEAAELVAFLCGNEWPFHGSARLDEVAVRHRIAAGHYWNSDREAFWIEAPERIGYLALEDLADLADGGNPVFDLRLAEQYRGRGLAVPVLRALAGLVFERFPSVRRLEGQTREDNLAMRKAFRKAGFLKEAHYRQAWPTGDGGYLASVAYGLLRGDFETGTVSSFDWAD